MLGQLGDYEKGELAFGYYFVNLEFAGAGERLFRWSVCMGLDERVAVGPVLEILHRLPVGNHHIMVGLDWFQNFGANETRMICNCPLPIFPSPLKFFFRSFCYWDSVRNYNDHGGEKQV